VTVATPETPFPIPCADKATYGLPERRPQVPIEMGEAMNLELYTVFEGRDSGTEGMKGTGSPAFMDEKFKRARQVSVFQSCCRYFLHLGMIL
jgi:hypothetical protein